MPLSRMMEDQAHVCVLLKSSRVLDEAGGWKTIWTDGAMFKAYPARDTSTLTQIAERDDAESIYTVLTPQDAPVELGDRYRDETEGAVFHILSRPNERMTPAMSPLGLKLFKAEKKELPA